MFKFSFWYCWNFFDTVCNADSELCNVYTLSLILVFFSFVRFFLIALLYIALYRVDLLDVSIVCHVQKSKVNISYYFEIECEAHCVPMIVLFLFFFGLSFVCINRSFNLCAHLPYINHIIVYLLSNLHSACGYTFCRRRRRSLVHSLCFALNTSFSKWKQNKNIHKDFVLYRESKSLFFRIIQAMKWKKKKATSAAAAALTQRGKTNDVFS